MLVKIFKIFKIFKIVKILKKNINKLLAIIIVLLGYCCYLYFTNNIVCVDTSIEKPSWVVPVDKLSVFTNTNTKPEMVENILKVLINLEYKLHIWGYPNTGVVLETFTIKVELSWWNPSNISFNHVLGNTHVSIPQTPVTNNLIKEVNILKCMANTITEYCYIRNPGRVEELIYQLNRELSMKNPNINNIKEILFELHSLLHDSMTKQIISREKNI